MKDRAINTEMKLEKTIVDDGVEKSYDTLLSERRRNKIVFPILAVAAVYLTYWSFGAGVGGFFTFLFIVIPVSLASYVCYSKVKRATYLLDKLDGKIVEPEETTVLGVGNTSGMGKKSEVPPEIKGWNWGAFLLNWVWGIGNSTYIALLMFVPLVNIVMLFMLGAKGNEWAWRNRLWRDIEHFKGTQRKWSIAGALIVCVGFPAFFVSLQGAMKGEAYELSLHHVQSSPEVTAIIGTPVEPGFFVLGEISKGSSGTKASLRYSISGPKGDAETFLYAIKEFDEWVLHNLIVYSEDYGKKLVLIEQENKMPNKSN